MNIPEFVEYAANSTQQYLDFVRSKNGGGAKFILVKDIKQKKDPLILYLYLDESLRSTDGIEIVYEKDANTFETVFWKDFSINSYDEEKKYLSIRTASENTVFYKNPRPHFYIKIDMSFLIERFLKWYKSADALKIRYPSAPFDALNEYLFIPEHLSEEQRCAVHTAFTAPLSYVWGPPGTGKTSAVLSTCLLNYVGNELPVLVLAPTNNAVEQSLRGILKVLKEYDHPTTAVLRLGVPSKEFAKQYPEACESTREIHLSKQIKKLEKEKACMLSERELLRTPSNDLKVLSGIDSAYRLALKKHEEYEADLQKTLLSISDAFSSLNENKASLAKLNGALAVYQDELYALQLLQKSFGYKFKSFFKRSLRVVTEERINQLHNLVSETGKKVFSLQKDIQETEYSLQNLQNKEETLRIEIEASLKNLDKIYNEIPYAFSLPIDFDENQALLFGVTSPEQMDTVHKRRLLILKYQIDQTKRILSEKPKKEELDELIEINEKETDRLREIVKDGHKNIFVYACTVDTFLSYLHDFVHTLSSEEELKQNPPKHKSIFHIFLDEAAYCPLPKCGPIFAAGVPVTLLGDHMQLPPVCEAEKKDISDYHDLCFWASSSLHCCEFFEDYITPEHIFARYDADEEPSFSMMERTFLKKTYRFGETLASILSDVIYPAEFNGIEEDTAILLLDATPAEPYSGKLKEHQNMHEALAIKKYIEKKKPKDFVILTPYRNQVDILNRVLPEYKDQISTIHKSQGQEWHTVIISITDTRKKFLTNTKHIPRAKPVMNTAISRAKEEIILCYEPSHWLRREGQLVGKLAAQAKPITL